MLRQAHEQPAADPGTPPAPRVTRERSGPWFVLGEPRRADWIRVELPLATLKRGVRLVHLSDFHVRRRPAGALDWIRRRLEADPPDAILFTGDLLDDKLDNRPSMSAARDALAGLPARWGIFGVLGNHDGDLLLPRLEALGITPVEGRRLRIEPEPGFFLDLVGLPSVSRTDPSPLFDADRDPAVPCIALTHFPDHVRRLGRLRPDVIFAGHTHGGQVCLPGGRAIITHDSLPRSMCAGVHSTEQGVLIITRGLGTASLPVRLFAPPEVIEVTLLPGKPGE